jgi:hypothetical protein
MQPISFLTPEQQKSILEKEILKRAANGETKEAQVLYNRWAEIADVDDKERETLYNAAFRNALIL